MYVDTYNLKVLTEKTLPEVLWFIKVFITAGFVLINYLQVVKYKQKITDCKKKNNIKNLSMFYMQLLKIRFYKCAF